MYKESESSCDKKTSDPYITDLVRRSSNYSSFMSVCSRSCCDAAAMRPRARSDKELSGLPIICMTGTSQMTATRAAAATTSVATEARVRVALLGLPPVAGEEVDPEAVAGEVADGPALRVAVNAAEASLVHVRLEGIPL